MTKRGVCWYEKEKYTQGEMRQAKSLYLESANGAIAIKIYFVIAHTYSLSLARPPGVFHKLYCSFSILIALSLLHPHNSNAKYIAFHKMRTQKKYFFPCFFSVFDKAFAEWKERKNFRSISGSVMQFFSLTHYRTPSHSPSWKMCMNFIFFLLNPPIPHLLLGNEMLKCVYIHMQCNVPDGDTLLEQPK